MKSSRRFDLVLLEEHESVSLYSIRFASELDTEFEQFMKYFRGRPGFEKDLYRIVYWVDKIGKAGALERYFRPESKMADGVCAVPVENNRLRLYCLRLSDGILIMGNGGVKDQKTYNVDPHLKECVDVLAELDFCIKQKQTQGRLSIMGKIIFGDLSF